MMFGRVLIHRSVVYSSRFRFPDLDEDTWLSIWLIYILPTNGYIVYELKDWCYAKVIYDQAEAYSTLNLFLLNRALFYFTRQQAVYAQW